MCEKDLLENKLSNLKRAFQVHVGVWAVEMLSPCHYMQASHSQYVTHHIWIMCKMWAYMCTPGWVKMLICYWWATFFVAHTGMLDAQAQEPLPTNAGITKLGQHASVFMKRICISLDIRSSNVELFTEPDHFLLDRKNIYIKIIKIKSLNTTLWGRSGSTVIIKYKSNALHFVATVWGGFHCVLPPLF